MDNYNPILKLLKKRYKHIKNIKNIKINNKKVKIVSKRLGINNAEIKHYLSRYEKDICHAKDPDCANCVLIEFCDDLGDGFSYHKKMKCNKCGHCCTLLLNLTERDIERIKKTGYKEEEFIEEQLGRKYMKLIDHKCFFLKKNKSYYCEIYKHRPQICRIYPSYDREIRECREHIRLKILHQLPK